MKLRLSLLATAATWALLLQSAVARAEEESCASEKDQFASDETEPHHVDILVTARRWQEPDIGNLPIDIIVGESELLIMGSDTVGALVDSLGPRSGSARGANYSPVILINGRRADNRSEVASLPAEAVERVEILSPEASSTYGSLPGRPVLNLVLKSDFHAMTMTGSETAATEGAFYRTSANTTYTKITGPSRLSLQLTALRDSPLFEADRNIPLEPVPAGIMIAPIDRPISRTEPGFRSLLPANRTLKASATYTVPVQGLTSMSIDASVELARSEKGLGLVSGTILAPTLPDFRFVRRYAEFLPPLEQEVDAGNFTLGAQLSGQYRRWNWNAGISLSRGMLETASDLPPSFSVIQQAVDMGLDPLGPIPPSLLGQSSTFSSRFATNSADLFLSARGPILELPAGTAWLNLSSKLGAFETAALTKFAVTSRSEFSRVEASVAASLLVPLTGSLPGTEGNGELTLGLGLGARAVSDFGSTFGTELTMTWRPKPTLRLHGSLSSSHEVPNVTQLSAPHTVTPGIRIYDLLRGETVTVQSIREGNTALRSENDRTMQIGAVFQPFSKERNLSFTADFTDRTVRNPIGYVSASAEMQLAFPERFGLDGTGSIESIDNSAVNFVRSRRQSLRLGVQWSWPLVRKRTGDSGRPADRLTGFISHEWIFADRLTLNRHVSVDFLGGDAKGFPGNSPRHYINGKLGFLLSGFGAEVRFGWEAASELRKIATASSLGSETFHFSHRLQIDLGAHIDFGRGGLFGGNSRVLNGTRLRIGVENLTNSRSVVRRKDGTTPYGYLGPLLSPQGRLLTVGLRKSY